MQLRYSAAAAVDGEALLMRWLAFAAPSAEGGEPEQGVWEAEFQ